MASAGEGNERLRQLLVLGASAIVRVAVHKPEAASVSPWLRKLLERKPRKVAAVRPGQQDRPHRVGHDGERPGVSQPDPRLTRPPVPRKQV